MQYLDILFFYAFSCSVLWAYGIGLEKSFFDSRNGSRFMRRMPLLVIEIAVAAIVVFELNAKALIPAGLTVLIPVTTVLLCSLIQMLAQTVFPPSSNDFSAGERVFSFGSIFLATSEGSSLFGALFIALGSALAFWFATILLFAVRERIAAAEVKVDWKGAPLILAAMGLLSIVMYSADVSWWIQEAFK